MKISISKLIYQGSDYMEDLAKKNGTTVSTCGYITCALIEYLSEIIEGFDLEKDLSVINQKSMTPYIEKCMQSIKARRKLQVQKYKSLMSPKQQINYLRDWVANHEIQDYLSAISQKMLNPQVYFFRQSPYDHPEAMQNIKYEEKERVKEQIQFKGEQIYYNKFQQGKKPLFVHKTQFINELNKSDKKLPVLIATDVMGHFNVTILFKGQVKILDSLTQKGFGSGYYDEKILNFIVQSYKKSYLKQ